jgi:hypothetical protein
MVKASVMLKRKPGMSPAEFHRYWKDVHGPLVLGVSEFMRHFRKYGRCPSIACMKGLRSVVSRLLIEPVAKVWGHAIAQQLLHGPYMVCQARRHSRRDRLPPLG